MTEVVLMLRTAIALLALAASPAFSSDDWTTFIADSESHAPAESDSADGDFYITGTEDDGHVICDADPGEDPICTTTTSLPGSSTWVDDEIYFDDSTEFTFD